MSKPRLEKPAHIYESDVINDDSLFGVGVLPVSRSRRRGSGNGNASGIGNLGCIGCGSSQAQKHE